MNDLKLFQRRQKLDHMKKNTIIISGKMHIGSYEMLRIAMKSAKNAYKETKRIQWTYKDDNDTMKNLFNIYESNKIRSWGIERGVESINLH